MLGLDLARLELREALQAQIEDRARLDLGQVERVDQSRARLLGVGGAPYQRDHGVDVPQGDQQPFEDVRARLRPLQAVAGPARHHVALVVEVVRDQLAQAQRPWHAVDERDRVDAEGDLGLGVLVELVEDHHRHRVAAQLDHDPDAVAAALVVQVGDLGDHLLLDELRGAAEELGLVDLVGELREDDRVRAALERLVVRPPLHPHPPAAGRVRVPDAGVAPDDPARREVRALDVTHQPVDADLRIVDHRHDGVDRLADVVRRDVGRHPDRDAGGPVDEQVRDPRGQDERLGPPVVVRGGGIDGLLVDVAEHLGGDGGEPRLRVAHRRRLELARAEVALAVDERVPGREVLRQADERVVDRRVAVGVVVTHDGADDVGALAVRAVRLEAGVVHREQHPAVHGLEAVPHVRQRPADDHAHRVVEVRRAHLLLELVRLDPSVTVDRHQPPPMPVTGITRRGSARSGRSTR